MLIHIYDPRAEIIGQNFQVFKKNNQTASINPVRWYPLRKWLHMLDGLVATSRDATNFVEIGIALANTFPLPHEAEKMTLEGFFRFFDEIYQMQHRNGDVGSITVQKMETDELQITVHSSPYPDDLIYGVVYGFTLRFLKKGQHFVLKQESKGRTLKLHLKWQ